MSAPKIPNPWTINTTMNVGGLQLDRGTATNTTINGGVQYH